MAKSCLLTITVTILLVCIYHGETVDSPAKPANGIQKPPVDKPGQPPVAKPPTQAKPPPAKPPTQAKPPAAKPPTQAKPPAAKPPTQAKPPANPPAKPPANPPAKPPTHSKRTTPHGTHGGVPMGIPTPYCDDGIRKVQIDYDKKLIRKVCSPRFCTNWQKKREISILKKLRAKKTLPVATSPVVKPDDCKNDLKTEGLCCTPPQEAIHKCLNEKITYDSPIPTSGEHRPLWPKYGEYAYLPPQRWIHNLEHGGIVFLYHPCADQEQINQLRTIAFSCLYKIIITPSNKLAVENPFAVLSWGCRLLLPDVNKEKITAFIKEKALTAPESYETKEGQFDRGLIRPVGQIVYEDARGAKCPEIQKTVPSMLEALTEQQSCREVLTSVGLLNERSAKWVGDMGRSRVPTNRRASKRHHTEEKRLIKPELMYLDKLASKSFVKRNHIPHKRN